MSKSVCLLQSLKRTLRSHEAWDIFPEVGPFQNMEHQVLRLHFNIHTDTAFKHVWSYALSHGNPSSNPDHSVMSQVFMGHSPTGWAHLRLACVWFCLSAVCEREFRALLLVDTDL